MNDPHRRELKSALLLTSRCRLTLKGRMYMNVMTDGRSDAPPERGLQLNDTGRFVLGRCDGAYSVGELAKDLARAWQVPEARACSDVLNFLENLRDQGLVQADD